MKKVPERPEGEFEKQLEEKMIWVTHPSPAPSWKQVRNMEESFLPGGSCSASFPV